MRPAQYHENLRPGAFVAYLWAQRIDGAVVQTTGVPESDEDLGTTIYLISAELVGHLGGRILAARLPVGLPCQIK